MTMERLSVCVVTLCLAVAAFNIISVETRSVSEDRVNTSEKCLYHKEEYNVGEKWSVLGDCSIYTCHEGGAISILTCAVVAVPEDSSCTFTEVDLKKMYPKCCPQLVCPQE